MKFIKIIIIILSISFPSLVKANMRQAFLRSLNPSYSIQNPGNGLIAISETLEFNCDSPYEGDLSIVMKTRKYCEVKSNYNINTINPGIYKFVFYLPSDNKTSIALDKKGEFRNLIPILESGRFIKEFPEFDERLYKVEFELSLERGFHEIQVDYSQPIGADEVRHGYFTTSRWASSIAYELWPLSEWTLSEDFKMKIKFIMKDDKGLLDYIFGTANEILFYSNSKDNKKREEIKVSIKEKGSLLFLEHEFEKNFPDRIIFTFGEKKYIRR